MRGVSQIGLGDSVETGMLPSGSDTVWQRMEVVCMPRILRQKVSPLRLTTLEGVTQFT